MDGNEWRTTLSGAGGFARKLAWQFHKPDVGTARVQETVGPTFPASMPKNRRAETIARFSEQQRTMLRQSCENEPQNVICQRLLRLYKN
jgi:hypothetical protein